MEIANFRSYSVISGQFDGLSKLAGNRFVGTFVFAIVKGKMEKLGGLEAWLIFRVDLSWRELLYYFFKLGTGACDVCFSFGQLLLLGFIRKGHCRGWCCFRIEV